MKENNSNHISEKVFNKIKSEEIKMKPSCLFMICSWAWLGISWMLFLAATLLVSLNTHYIHTLEPIDLLGIRPLILLEAFPYLLIAITIGMLFLAAKTYRKGRNYCRHENWMLVGVLVFGALLIGVTIQYAHLEYEIRMAMEKNTFYNNMVITPREFWSQPEKGTLSGLITKTDGQGNIWIKSWDGSKWKVNVDKSCCKQDDSSIEMRMIKVIGQQNGSRQFEAQSFWNW